MKKKLVANRSFNFPGHGFIRKGETFEAIATLARVLVSNGYAKEQATRRRYRRRAFIRS